MQTGVDVERTGGRIDSLVRANGDRLHQVLINVLSNAIKYNDAASPKVEVSLTATHRNVVIDIKDNGSGVPPTEADSIFEKFARGKLSTRSQGVGLGLPISRAIMHAMGGDLLLNYERDGASSFRIRLAASGQKAVAS